MISRIAPPYINESTSNEVLFIETKANVFGGQKALLARCAELDRLGIKYKVIHPFAHSDFLDQYKSHNISGEVISPRANCSKIQQSLFILRKLLRIDVQRGALTIHCDAFDSAYLVAIMKKIGKIKDVKLIFTIRSERYLRFNFIDKNLIRSFDRICTNSQYSREKISAATSIQEEFISVTGSPIDFEGLSINKRGFSLSEGVITIGYVGSFDSRKRLDRFVDFGLSAIQEISCRELNFKIYGEPKNSEQENIRSSLVSEIEKHNATDRFHFCGYQPASDVAQEIDILFCPFDNEPLGRVVPEFLYMGIPVIAHDSGGLREAGLGYALMISGESEDTMRSSFLRSIGEILTAQPRREDDIKALRSTLVEHFGSSSVVKSEISEYRLLKSH